MASLIRIGVKFGILGGALYITHQEGVWSDAKKSQEAYDKFCNSLQKIPGYKEYVPMIPDITKSSRSAVDYWNCGVKWTFNGLVSLPSSIQTGIAKGVDMAKEAINKSL